MSISRFSGRSRMSHSLSTLRLACLIAFLVGVLAIEGGCATNPFSDMFGKQDTRLTKGPFLLGVYPDRAALMWETETEGPCKLYYGGDRKLDKYVESVPETHQAGEEDVKKLVFIHKVWLEGLGPGRFYDYRVTGPGFQDKIYRFRTVPENTDEVRFIVYGDSRTRPSVHRRLVKLMKNQKVDFVVNCGDLVTKGDKYEQWGPQFFEPLKGLAETVPVYIAKGNHEGDNGNYEKLLIPKGRKNSFGFDYGPVHYFCADNVTEGLEDEVQLELIIADAGASDAKWKFVSYHVPSVNFGGHWSAWGYPDALPGLSKAGVDFVLAGHSHLYERFRPVALTEGADGSYVTYITSGGGGMFMHGIKPNVYHAVAKKKHHFCLFDIKGNKLTMDTIGIDGRVIDHIEVIKNAGRLDKKYLRSAIPMKEMLDFQQMNLHRQD
ncbi:MAG TPA: metallophosphoesterase family protein [Sedimentisphaerales bacterium]|nr:metallophosphoesterase family protein [Sedimentisphaerales bacterium]